MDNKTAAAAQCAGQRAYRGNVDIGADLRCQNNATKGSAFCHRHQPKPAPPAPTALELAALAQRPTGREIVALEIGDFISVPAWRVTVAQVIDTRPATLGSDDAQEVLLEVKPDDPNPRWYRLEPGQFTVESYGS